MLPNEFNIITLDDNSINSSDFADMRASITHSKNNKLTLDNISTYYILENSIILSASILKKYENILRQRVIDYTVTQDKFYRPEYVSYDVYKTTDLWYLILFLNNMTRPDEFTKTNIQVFDPAYIDLLNNIIEKEKNVIGNQSNPVVISRELVKDLNAPSAKILSSSYNKRIAPLTPPTKPKSLITVTDFSTSFINNYFPILRNKLLKRNYTILDNAGNVAQLNKIELSDNFKLNPDCTTGLPISFRNNYRQEFEGYIYIPDDGFYEFKPVIAGTFKLWLDGDRVINTNNENWTVNENIFESQTGNSDFKKGNADGWEINDGLLYQDPETGKTYLRKTYNRVPNGSNIATVNLDVSDINTNRDLAVTTTYKAINNNGNLLFAGAQVVVTYTNGKTETFSNNYWYGYFNNTGSFVDAVIIVTFQKGLTLKSITINFPASRKPYYNQVIDADIYISSLKVQEVKLDSFKIELKGNKWHTLKAQYDMISQPTSYLRVLWKKPNDTYYNLIPSSILAFTPDASIRDVTQPYSALNSFYSYDEKIMYTQLINYSNDFSYNDTNPDPLFVPPNTDYIIKQESIMNFYTNRRYKIEANINDEVQVFKDGELWFDKPKGIDNVEQLDPETSVPKKSNISIIYKHKVGNGDPYFRFKINPDEYYNPTWGTFYPQSSFKPGEFLDPWSANSNNISLKPYASGIANYYYKNMNEMSDYRIKVLINTDSTLYYGNYGVIFRMQNENEYYLYTIRRDNQPQGSQMNLLSGLYKVSPRYSKINMTSDGMFTINAKLLARTPQKYIGTETCFVFIMIYNNTIRIYDKFGGRPIIEYVDTDDPFLTGSYGFHVFKQSQVNFSDIEVSY